VTKPAVMQGVYVDCKFMAGFKVARISIDIPIEHSNEFPVHVVVARMDVEALKAPTVPERPAEPAPVERGKAKRSSLAYLMCRDIAFQQWIGCKETLMPVHPDAPIHTADQILKDRLGIMSKTELDTDPKAAARFDALRTDFELRDMVR